MKIIHKNKPVFMTVYKDPDSLKEKLKIVRVSAKRE
jgi:hypothetical protein